MNTHNEMPQALQNLIQSTPSQTRAKYTQKRLLGVCAVGALWIAVATRGVVHGTANVPQVVAYAKK